MQHAGFSISPGIGAGAAGPQPPKLVGLTLSVTSFEEGQAAGTLISPVIGRAAGSTIELIAGEGAVALAGSNVVVGSTASDQGDLVIFWLRETLPEAINSPHDTPISLNVTAATAFLASLAFNDSRNSQYVGQVI